MWQLDGAGDGGQYLNSRCICILSPIVEPVVVVVVGDGDVGKFLLSHFKVRIQHVTLLLKIFLTLTQYHHLTTSHEYVHEGAQMTKHHLGPRYPFSFFFSS